jgi:hypothetical protein
MKKFSNKYYCGYMPFMIFVFTLYFGVLSPLSPLSVVSAKQGILLNLSMKYWNSAFNAQGSRVTIVVVQVRATKIYVTAVETLRKMEIQVETQFTTKIGGKTSLGPSSFVL